jgi:hypothetical protein
MASSICHLLLLKNVCDLCGASKKVKGGACVREAVRGHTNVRACCAKCLVVELIERLVQPVPQAVVRLLKLVSAVSTKNSALRFSIFFRQLAELVLQRERHPPLRGSDDANSVIRTGRV